mmetsp:Transcript_4490/g.13621  ORF Transcript_4490/g.13621 Transcript_4490/m.13621 type:complete len:210 (+) Transcript_4490:901-1530(+)
MPPRQAANLEVHLPRLYAWCASSTMKRSVRDRRREHFLRFLEKQSREFTPPCEKTAPWRELLLLPSSFLQTWRMPFIRTTRRNTRIITGQPCTREWSLRPTRTSATAPTGTQVLFSARLPAERTSPYRSLWSPTTCLAAARSVRLSRQLPAFAPWTSVCHSWLCTPAGRCAVQTTSSMPLPSSPPFSGSFLTSTATSAPRSVELLTREQ